MVLAIGKVSPDTFPFRGRPPKAVSSHVPSTTVMGETGTREEGWRLTKIGNSHGIHLSNNYLIEGTQSNRFWYGEPGDKVDRGTQTTNV
jgi:hypothetical protein